MRFIHALIVAGAALWVLPTVATADAIKVTLLGTGTPVLNIDRFGMSTLVEAGGKKLLFDVGRGATMRLHQARIPLRDITAVFVTHLHSDHVAGLPDLYATAPLTSGGGRQIPLEVWGPQGIDSVARGVETMFTENTRIRLLGKELVPAVTRISAHSLPAQGGTAYDEDGVRVTAFLVNHGHAEPAYGYRVEYGDRAVVLSGDTTYSPNLVKYAKGADLLVHCVAIGSRRLEAAAPEFVQRFYEYLASPEMAGRILDEVRPRLAVFSHISLYSRGDIPRADSDELSSRVRAIYAGPFVIGEDLMSFTVGSSSVVSEPYSATKRQQEPR
jgi:ribonuclease Z